MLTGRRQFKRTGMKETVKTKWELRRQERKKTANDCSQSWYTLVLFSAVDRTCLALSSCFLGCYCAAA